MSTSVSTAAVRWTLMAALIAAYIVAPSAAGQNQPPEPAPPAPADSQNPADGPDDQTDDQEPTPFFRSGVNFIRVDTIVTDDDGNHVLDLQASDFEVYEDGEPQTIETFDLIEIGAVPEPGARPASRIATPADEEREAARSDVRVLVIFFDDYHVRFENGQRAALTMTEFLRDNLLPTDLVAVMYPLTPVTDLRLTRNHESIISQVEAFFGRKYDYDPRNLYEQQYSHYPATIVERIRNDVSMSALNGLLIHLGGLREARKSVLLVSEGYTNYLPPQMRGRPGDSTALVDPFAGDNYLEERTQFFTDTEVLIRIRELYQTANRFNTSIYSLDPRGLAVGEYDVSNPTVSIETSQRTLRSTQDTLHLLAEQTDGRAIINRNDIEPGLSQMMSDASTYYLLGYTSNQAPTDGRFHEIEVRVKRDDVQVRNRSGYWAITERDAIRVMRGREDREPPRALDVALSALAEPRRGHLVRTWVGTSRGENGRTRVTFVWEPTREPAGRDDPARVLLTAMGDPGGALFRGRIPESTGSAGRGLAGGRATTDSGLSMATFDAEPGVMQLSVAVEGEGGEVLDRDRDEIDVPDFTGTGVVLSTPAFVRARNNLEWQALVEDWDAVPTVSREFRRTERLLLRFEAYAPGTVVPRIETWLLNRGGDRMYPLTTEPAEDGQRYQVDIQPTGLPPGEYVVEVKATIPDDETTQLVAFRLGS